MKKNTFISFTISSEKNQGVAQVNKTEAENLCNETPAPQQQQTINKSFDLSGECQQQMEKVRHVLKEDSSVFSVGDMLLKSSQTI